MRLLRAEKDGERMAIGDIYEVRLEGICNSAERWNHVLHYKARDENGLSQYDLTEQLAVAVGDDYQNKIMGLLAEDHYYTSCRCVKIFPELGVPVVVSEAAAVAGSVVAESLPADVAVVATKRTEQAGRIGIGRLFISGIPESSAELDSLITTVHSAWSDGVGDFLLVEQNTTGSAIFDTCVFSRKLAENDPPPPEVAFNVVRAEVDSTLRNQRPRGRSTRIPFSATATQ